MQPATLFDLIPYTIVGPMPARVEVNTQDWEHFTFVPLNEGGRISLAMATRWAYREGMENLEVEGIQWATEIADVLKEEQGAEVWFADEEYTVTH